MEKLQIILLLKEDSLKLLRNFSIWNATLHSITRLDFEDIER